MTDPWAAPPEPPGRPPGAPYEVRDAASRVGCALALVGLFVVGFVAVGAIFLLRAPEPMQPPPGNPLAALMEPPPGYLVLDDDESGGGRLDYARASVQLGVGFEGFQDASLGAWGRRPGEPVRAVVVLVVDVGTAGRASDLRSAYVAAELARGGTAFQALDGYDGIRAVPDPSGRHANRVAFTDAGRVWVVSVFTPAAENDTGEVVALAQRQAAALAR